MTSANCGVDLLEHSQQSLGAEHFGGTDRGMKPWSWGSRVQHQKPNNFVYSVWHAV